jgi:hypothetical protein
MTPAFYTIRDENTKLYLSSSTRISFDSNLVDTTARFSATGAQKAVNEAIKMGYDCSRVVIIPVAVTALEPIKPKLPKPGKGRFVIQIYWEEQRPVWPPDKFNPDKTVLKKNVLFVRGNKRKPETYNPSRLFSTFDIGGGHGTAVRVPERASQFDTKQEAEIFVKEIRSNMPKEIDNMQKSSIYRVQDIATRQKLFDSVCLTVKKLT